MIDIEDASGYRGQADELLTPANEDELAAILAREVPVTIAGALTGVTGAAVPEGGLAVSMQRFHRLDIGRGSARAGAGDSLKQYQSAAAPTNQD
jgi:FAD/FMN-containing dehydrogenase